MAYAHRATQKFSWERVKRNKIDAIIVRHVIMSSRFHPLCMYRNQFGWYTGLVGQSSNSSGIYISIFEQYFIC